MKKCSKCGKEKERSEFHKDKTKKDGFRPNCKMCRINQQKEHYKLNKNKISAQKRIYEKNNPERRRSSDHKRRARKFGNGGSYITEEWNNLCNLYEHKCLCCNAIDKKLTVDHILPLVLGGNNSIENIQPLCLSCNCSKGIKHIDYRPDSENYIYNTSTISTNVE